MVNYFVFNCQKKKEMHQLEAKIETGRHNLKIKMDKELNVL